MLGRPKRHHQVPRSYLNRFAADERVFVRRRDGGTFEANTLNVAVETGFYDIPDGEGGSSSAVEEVLAVADGAAAGALARVDQAGRPPSESSNDRVVLATFVALQMTRTSEHRERAMFPERVVAWLGDRTLTESLMAEYLEKVHLGFPPRPREAEAAHDFVSVAIREGVPGEEFGIKMMLEGAAELLPRVLALRWTLEADPQRGFITSDRPVVIWSKPSRQDAFRGIGIETAHEVRFPIDPSCHLVLAKRTRLDRIEVAPHRVRKCNQDMAAGCHRFILGNAESRRRMEALSLHRRGPAVRFNLAPLYVDGPNGPERQDGEVLHMFVPRRSQSS